MEHLPVKHYLLLICLVCCGPFLKAQKTQVVIVQFQPYWTTQRLQLDTDMITAGMPVIQISKFRCYISHITLSKNGGVTWQETNSVHLIDAEDAASYSIKLQIPTTLLFDQIHFNMGIDSATNVSGAMDGDLDPTKGMYWAWNSGYVNFKLEGSSPACNTRNNKFQFHVGGFSMPFSTLQQISLATLQSNNIPIALQLDQLFIGLNLQQQNSIMQPCREAVEFSKKIAGIFHIGS